MPNRPFVIITTLIAVIAPVAGLLVACGATAPTARPTPGAAASSAAVATTAMPSEPPATHTDLPSPAPADTETPAATTLVPLPSETTVVPAPLLDGRGGLIAFYSERDGNPEIYVMNADGSDQTRLTYDPGEDVSPSLSPDGTQIVFLTSRHDPDPQFPHLKYEIYLIDVDGSNPRRLTTSEAAETHPAWTPDGTRISFDADYEGDGYGEIYTIQADGTGLTRLTTGEANDQWASWSPDGSQIAFSSDRDGNYEIYVMAADGRNAVRLTDHPDIDFFPEWSPDGRRIAFGRVRAGSRNADVYVMHADGGNEVRLTDSPGYDEDAVWSPDSLQLVFQSDRDGDFDLYLMQADGSDQRPLVDEPGGDFWPSWGPAPEPGAGTVICFERSSQTFPSVPTFRIGLGDLDGDGDLDAAMANGQANASRVWLNEGGVQGGTEGEFAVTDQELTAYAHGIDVGDLDGDGDLDLVVTCHTDSRPSQVYLNDGHAAFQPVEQGFSGNIGYSVHLADVDGDGDLDALALDSPVTALYVNDGLGRFSATDASFPEASVWGDLDGDGDVDLFYKEEGVGYASMLNDGKGRFSSHWAHKDLEALLLGDMALSDLDGDGDLDVVITNGHYASTSHPALVFLNDGMGRFADSSQRLSAVRNAGLALGDLDADGDLDLVLTDYMEPNQVWLNDGTGLFEDSGFRFGGGQFYRHPHLGDLDGDGDLDILLAAFGLAAGPNEIWLNTTP